MTLSEQPLKPIAAEELLVRWRARVSPLMMRAFLIIALPVIASSVYIEFITGHPQFGLLWAGFYLAIAAAVLQKRTGNTAKAVVMLTLMYLGGGIIGNLRAGLMSDGRVYALAIPIMATILIGLGAGWAAVAVSTLIHSAFGYLAASGYLAETLAPNTLVMEDGWNWAYTGVVFFGLMLVNQMLIANLYRFTRNTLKRQREAYNQLESANSRNREVNADLERKNERLRQLARQLISAQEEERVRLARELHDGVLNQISSYLIHNETSDLTEGGKMLKHLGEELREMVYGLRPPMLNQGLAAGLEGLAAHLRGRTGRALKINFNVKAERGVRYPEEVETHIYRMVQEAGENSVQHSRATFLGVTGTLAEGQIDLTVDDDGIGFDSTPVLDRRNLAGQLHYGLAGLYERAAIINASVSIYAASGAGARIHIRWPAEIET
ncbi:MAG: hypothetical protein HYZ26_02110 [Chloroflexi bacterium]|nr:hypothetical protein [Chloroflexota bacterium]